jgi:hypothetical protein
MGVYQPRHSRIGLAKKRARLRVGNGRTTDMRLAYRGRHHRRSFLDQASDGASMSTIGEAPMTSTAGS